MFLQAHTVAVIIHPDAGIDLEQPDANKIAQRDLEAALLNWGSVDRTISRRNADLIIVVRKGNGRSYRTPLQIRDKTIGLVPLFLRTTECR